MTRDELAARVIASVETLRKVHAIEGLPAGPSVRIRDLGFESLHLVEFMLDLTEFLPEPVVERLAVDDATTIGGLTAQLHGLLLAHEKGCAS
jgi:hypothetical protein